MKIALIVGALVSTAAGAQDTSLAPATGAEAMARMQQVLSGPELPPAFPATPERMQLVRQYLDEGTMRQGMQIAVQTSRSRLRARMLDMARSMTRAQQALVAEAFDPAFDAAMAMREKRIYGVMETYFASRMSDDELRTVIDFYSAGVGYKSQHDAQDLSSADREEIGRHVVGDPAIAKFTKANLDYLKGAKAREEVEEPLFDSDFNKRFCNNLAAHRLRLSSCPSPLRPGAH